jgi:FixJ family two-component response regulator
VFLTFLANYRDRNCTEAATSSKLTIGTGDQDDAIALALASNMSATDLDVSEITVTRHRCQRLAHSHTLKIHGWITSLRSMGSEGKSLT